MFVDARYATVTYKLIFFPIWNWKGGGGTILFEYDEMDKWYIFEEETHLPVWNMSYDVIISICYATDKPKEVIWFFVWNLKPNLFIFFRIKPRDIIFSIGTELCHPRIPYR